MKKFRIKVPASTSNLGPGFDALGLALTLYLTLTVHETASGFMIDLVGEGTDRLPHNEENLMVKVMKEMAPLFHYELKGLSLRVENEIPITRGLGSSASAIVAALLALNALSNANLSQAELLKLACQVEKHPDNVTPALVGGFTIASLHEENLTYVKQTVKTPLQIILAIPHFELSTTQARHAIPREINLQKASFNLAHTALVTAAFLKEDFSLLAEGMQDAIHQAPRSTLIPGMQSVLNAAILSGAYGAALSGAGPTLIAFSEKEGEAVGKAMQQAFADAGVRSTIKLVGINNRGAEVAPC